MTGCCSRRKAPWTEGPPQFAVSTRNYSMRRSSTNGLQLSSKRGSKSASASFPGVAYEFKPAGIRSPQRGANALALGISVPTVQVSTTAKRPAPRRLFEVGNAAIGVFLGPRTNSPKSPWRQPRGKWIVSLVNSHENATRIGWHLCEIDLRFAPELSPWWSMDSR